MKRKLLQLLVAIGCYFPVTAQFQPSAYPEVEAPVVYGTVAHVNHMSAYSMGNVIDPTGTPCDLYVYTWNQAGGLAWLKTKAGNPLAVIDQGILSAPFSGVNSMSAAIVYSPVFGLYQIVLAYSDNLGVHLNFYDWNAVGISPNSSYLLSADPSATVNVDAHRGYAYAVVWAASGNIHTLCGRMDGVGPLVGCENVFQPDMGGYFSPSERYINPDVAIGHGGSSGSGLTLHYVFTNFTGGPMSDAFAEAKFDFDYILSSCPPPGSYVVPAVEDMVYASPGSTFFYSAPRIDCPDHAPGTDDWSYILGEFTFSTTTWPAPPNYMTKVLAGRMNYAISGSPAHFVLNDGSMAGIDMTNGASNVLGDVAYEQDGKSVHFCWNKTATDPALGDYDFLGMILDPANNPATGDYLIMDFDVNIGQQSPCIALSGQNDESNFLFAVYPGMDPVGYNYTIYYKHVPWNNYGYRPGREEGDGLAATGKFTGFSAYPNPVRDKVTIALEGIGQQERQWSVQVIGITGRILKTIDGDIHAVNKALESIGKEISDHSFFIRVEDNETGVSHIRKLSRY